MEEKFTLRPDLQPDFLSVQASKEIASRQMLSFIIPPGTEAERTLTAGRGHAPDRPFFSLDMLPDGAIGEWPELFNWVSRDIYDVDGLLLFRDQTIDLGSGNEWHVRTAASDLLQMPVWSVAAGPALNVEALIEKALAVIRESTDLEPFIADGEEDVRLVAYNYPKLGILCNSRTAPDVKFVFDIGRRLVIPLDSVEPQENPESVTAIWSPYDVVVRSTIAHFRWLWKREMDLLPVPPKIGENLRKVIMRARESIKEEETSPALILIPQLTPLFCAAATAEMILRQHGIKDKDQNALAYDMDIGPHGAHPDNQVRGINMGLTSRVIRAEPDVTPSFEEAKIEILAERPFKSGYPGHARAVGGFRTELGDKNSLHIYDPYPENQGRILWERWSEKLNRNYMYVRPPSPPQ